MSLEVLRTFKVKLNSFILATKKKTGFVAESTDIRNYLRGTNFHGY